MNYNSFKEQLIPVLQELAGKDCRVELHPVEKNNGTILDTVIIMKKGECIAPTFYLKDFYSWYRKGISLQQIAQKILTLNHEYHIDEPENLCRILSDYRKVRPHICYKLINYQRNQTLLSKIPHIPYLDLAIVFYFRIQQSDFPNSSILIYNEHMISWEVTIDNLFHDACLNTCRRLPFQFQGIEELLCTLSNTPVPAVTSEEHMYILTNQEKYFGASALLYPHVLSHISALLNNNFFVLPSSIHECILIPDSGLYSKSELEIMVKEVNTTNVDPEEILSDHVYYFDRTRQTLSDL
ncbi:MAG: DUF5688 family protein [Blautia sp.]